MLLKKVIMFAATFDPISSIPINCSNDAFLTASNVKKLKAKFLEVASPTSGIPSE